MLCLSTEFTSKSMKFRLLIYWDNILVAIMIHHWRKLSIIFGETILIWWSSGMKLQSIFDRAIIERTQRYISEEKLSKLSLWYDYDMSEILWYLCEPIIAQLNLKALNSIDFIAIDVSYFASTATVYTVSIAFISW